MAGQTSAKKIWATFGRTNFSKKDLDNLWQGVQTSAGRTNFSKIGGGKLNHIWDGRGTNFGKGDKLLQTSGQKWLYGLLSAYFPHFISLAGFPLISSVPQ